MRELIKKNQGRAVKSTFICSINILPEYERTLIRNIEETDDFK